MNGSAGSAQARGWRAGADGRGLVPAARMGAVGSSAIRDLLAHAAQPGMLSLAGGLPASDGFDVEGLREAMGAAFGDAPASLQYGPTEGVPALREAIARLMGARGAPVDASRVLVTTGSQQALDLVARVLVDPGDEVIVERPSYLAALQVFALAEARVRTIGSDAQGARIEELPGFDADDRRPVPRLVYLVPNFGNPSGATLSAARRRALLAWAVRHQVPILEDDPYGEIWFDSPPPASLLAMSAGVPGAQELVLHVSTLSKIVSPALRVGWVVAPVAIAGQLVRAKQAMDLQTATLTQAAAAHYLLADGLARRMPALRRRYAQRRDALAAALAARFGARLAMNLPAGGMFLWARFTDGTDTRRLLAPALAQRVMFVPGETFFAERPDATALRLSFSNVAPPDCAEAVDRLARAACVGGAPPAPQ